LAKIPGEPRMKCHSPLKQWVHEHGCKDHHRKPQQRDHHEGDAYRHLEDLRWGTTPRCSHCAGTDVYLIPPANGVSRKSAARTMSERRVWKCRDCKRQFSVLTGTMMHATKVPVRTWVLVTFDMCADKNGMSAHEVSRKYGVAPRTAWHMLHRIRQSMGSENKLVATMSGTIVSDETYMGGNPARMNAKGRARWEQLRADPKAGDLFSHGSAKIPVLSLVNAVTGEMRSQVIARVDGSTLRKAIAEQVDMANSALWTDEGTWYGPIGREFASHATVNHNEKQYVGRGGVSTNMLEGFFSQLKRSIDGTHHHVSREHLHRYLGEFDFRYSTCKMSDYGRMRTLAKQMEGRLSHKRLATT
jgi:transposase-like protein